MTCIVGLEYDGNVYIGGDSASVSGWSVNQTRIKKVFKTGEFIIGYTSSFRMGQILQYTLKVEPQNNFTTDLEYMATVFVDSVRDAFSKGGYKRVESEEETGGCFLVGYKGAIHVIHSDFQVNSSLDGFMSVGCGASFALGSLFETDGDKPLYRVERALMASSHFSGAVCEPFTVVSSADVCK